MKCSMKNCRQLPTSRLWPSSRMPCMLLPSERLKYHKMLTWGPKYSEVFLLELSSNSLINLKKQLTGFKKVAFYIIITTQNHLCDSCTHFNKMQTSLRFELYKTWQRFYATNLIVTVWRYYSTSRWIYTFQSSLEWILDMTILLMPWLKILESNLYLLGNLVSGRPFLIQYTRPTLAQFPVPEPAELLNFKYSFTLCSTMEKSTMRKPVLKKRKYISEMCEAHQSVLTLLFHGVEGDQTFGSPDGKQSTLLVNNIKRLAFHFGI